MAVSCAATMGCERIGEAKPLTERERPRAVDNSVAQNQRVVTFEGACDASGAVELDAHRFMLADDEDNVLRIYDADHGGRPLAEIDLSSHVSLESRKQGEADFEAATRIGDRAYVLASHGRSAKGKLDPNRHVLLATSLPDEKNTASVLGVPYRSLLDDMLSDPKLSQLGLREAATLAPKAPGGLNLEGMTAGADGSLLLGFRSPIPEGRALLVRLLNPEEVTAGGKGRFSEPSWLDLGGLGVRSLSSWRSNVLVIAGPSGDGGPFGLFRLEPDGRSALVDGHMRATRLDVDFTGFGPEGFFTPETRDEILVLSDDGTRLVGVQPCKKLKDDRQKSFRGIWLRLPL